MKFKELTEEDKVEFLSFFDQDKSKPNIVIEICEHFDIKPRTVYDWKNKINSKPYTNPHDILSDDKKKIHKQQEEIKHLKHALKEAKLDVHSTDAIKDLIHGVKEVGFNVEVPEWVSKSSNQKDNIVPVISVSDIHLGEVVNPKEVNYVNEYNTNIAIQRVNQCVDDFIDIYINKMSNYEYDGCVLILPGDNITNNLHDLSDTNDVSVINQIIEAVNLFTHIIKKLENSFSKVAVFAVSGNHGRLQPKSYTKTKGRFDNSLEKIVYHFMENEFSNNDNVNIVTNQSDIVRFSINGLKHQLEHGDTIKSTGTAIAGPVTGWERSRLKKSSIASTTGNKFDVLIIGHFHSHYISGNKLIVCNSTKGWDEYCQMLGIPFAPPGCTSYAVNNHGQIIFATDIQCRDVIEKKEFKKHIELF